MQRCSDDDDDDGGGRGEGSGSRTEERSVRKSPSLVNERAGLARQWRAGSCRTVGGVSVKM